MDRARRQIEAAARRTATASPTPHPGPLAGRDRGEGDERRTTATEEALLLATLAAYPDRVARRREPGAAEVVLVGGGSATLDPASVVRSDELLVAVDAEERRGDRRAPGGAPGRAASRVRLASRVTRELLLDVVPEGLAFRTQISWNGEAERVEAVEQLCYGDLVLESSRASAPPPGEVAAALAEAALARGVRAFAPEGAIDRLLARLALAGRCAPASGLAPPSEEELRSALGELCAGRRSFAELREADLVAALLARLPPGGRAQLERLAPERVALGGGRQVRVEYGAGQPPWIASRLQDFFGMARGPSVGGGAEPVTLHLLAPNQRAVQVTADLPGFWGRHYPALRRELSRRYPRHAWPEDPARAAPPARRAPAR